MLILGVVTENDPVLIEQILHGVIPVGAIPGDKADDQRHKCVCRQNQWPQANTPAIEAIKQQPHQQVDAGGDNGRLRGGDTQHEQYPNGGADTCTNIVCTIDGAGIVFNMLAMERLADTGD